MPGTFEVYEDTAGRFRFRLKASTGEVVASSRGYTTQSSAVRGARSMLRAAEQDPANDSSADPVPKQRDRGSRTWVLVEADDHIPSEDDRGRGGDEPSIPDGVEQPPRRRFRFTGGMAAEPDLAARSGEILRDEFGRD